MQDGASEEIVEIGPKKHFFAHFERFSVPKFCQMKDLIKVHIRGKFHQYDVCGCEA